MLLRKEPQFVKRLGTTWDSITHIPDLITLKKCMINSTLVAFDLEGFVPEINEAGLASISISKAKPLRSPVTGESGLQGFCNDNEVWAYNIGIWEERKQKYQESIKYGHAMTVHSAEIGRALHELLSTFQQNSDLILVGYAMYAEFDWISQRCPSFLSRFKYWVDVQEIVEECCGSSPGLQNTLVAMKINDRDPTRHRSHRASNDAVRTLAVLSSLATANSFNYQPDTRPKRLSKCPRHWCKFPFKARVTAKNKSKLPTRIKSSRDLAAYFESCHPTAVRINSRMAISQGVRVWWICVPAESILDKLVVDISESMLDGKELLVEKVVTSRMLESKVQHGNTWKNQDNRRHEKRNEVSDDVFESIGNLFSGEIDHLP